MAKYECKICGYVFDEQQAGESFDNLYSCPICDADKSVFNLIEADENTKNDEDDDDEFVFEEADENEAGNEEEKKEEESPAFESIFSTVSEFSSPDEKKPSEEDQKEETEDKPTGSFADFLKEKQTESTSFSSDSFGTYGHKDFIDEVLEENAKEEAQSFEEKTEDNSEQADTQDKPSDGGFVIEKRQEFWKKEDSTEEEKETPKEEKPGFSFIHMGSVERVIGEDAFKNFEEEAEKEKVEPERKEHEDNGLIQTFYSGKPVKSEEEFRAEEEEKSKENEFKPLWGDGMGAVQKVVGEEKKEEVKAESSDFDDSEELVFEEAPAENPVENEDEEEGVVYLNFDKEPETPAETSEEQSESDFEDDGGLITEKLFDDKKTEEPAAEEDNTETVDDFITEPASESEPIDFNDPENTYESVFGAYIPPKKEEEISEAVEESGAADIEETAETTAEAEEIVENTETAEETSETETAEEAEATEDTAAENEAAEEKADGFFEEEAAEAEENTEAVAEETETVAEEAAEETEAAVESDIAEETAETGTAEENTEAEAEAVAEEAIEETVEVEAEADTSEENAEAEAEAVAEETVEETVAAEENAEEAEATEETVDDAAETAAETEEAAENTETIEETAEETEAVAETEEAENVTEEEAEDTADEEDGFFEEADETAEAVEEAAEAPEDTTDFAETAAAFAAGAAAGVAAEAVADEIIEAAEEKEENAEAAKEETETVADFEMAEENSEAEAESSAEETEAATESETAEENAETEAAAETTEESAEEAAEAEAEAVAEETVEETEETPETSDTERGYICLDENEDSDGKPVAYSMLKRDTKYTVLYDTEAQKIFDDYRLIDPNISNGLENIILLPAQCNPLPLKRNAYVETKTVIGALTSCPVEVLQPFCFSKLFIWGEHIPNNSKPEKYTNQALVLVKGEEGHIPNLSSKEELREEVEIAKARYNGTPVGIDLVAGRIEDDLEACVYAKLDFVILNDVSSRILPYAIRRARNYLNRVNSKLEILVCVEALKDAQELAKILALGANFVLVERGFDIDMANSMTEALKEICRSTGHNNVHDLNLNDICTIDTDLAMYTDICHV